MNVAQALGVITPLVIVPLVFLASLVSKKETNTFHWLLKGGYIGAYLSMMLIVGPWTWTSYYLRWLWIGLFVAAMAIAYRRHRGVPFRIRGGMRTWSDVITLALFLAIGGYALTGLGVNEPAVSLDFPLRDGVYYVGQGGNNPLINYHNTHPAQKYALDILAIDAWGRRSTGLYPADLDQYVIYGKSLYSPCDGRITRAVDGLPDLAPPSSDPTNPAGNHVVIHCHGVNVVLAHLQEGSVAVREGDVVKAGELVGAVGNSGNTTEPHLHIHAVRAETDDTISGVGVPILFDGRFLVRNAVIRN